MPNPTAGTTSTNKALDIIISFLDDIEEAATIEDIKTAALMARMELSGIQVER